MTSATGEPSFTRDEVILEVENTPLRCNKKELSKHSDYFKVMFEGNFVESTKKTIKLESVSLKAITIILRLLWDERYFIEPEDLLIVLRAACMLQFVEIKRMCIKKITETLTPSNCLEVWQTCEVLDLDDLRLKAKSMALMEFSEIKDTDCLLKLDLRRLYVYLANRNLQCENEMIVFQTCMKWWYENSDEYPEESEEALLVLLACVDFSRLSNGDVREMQAYPDMSGNPRIVGVLNCIRDLKGDVVLSYDEGTLDAARRLLETRRRVFLEYACFWCENEHIKAIKRKLNAPTDVVVVYHDFVGSALKSLLRIGQEKYGNLDGFKMLGYKEFIFFFGGEYLIGKGNWNNNFWVYDSIREKWERKCLMPYKRRHFEACICGNYLYIIGGTGEFRALQDNMFWYNYKEDEWSKRIILPCLGRQVKCCEYKSQLFLLSISKKCGYLFEHNTSTWTTMKICDNDDVVPNFTDKFSLFSYRDSIFIKSDCDLIELKPEAYELIVVARTKFADRVSCDNMESVLCNGVLYTLYKHSFEDENGETCYKTSLEAYDMETKETSFLFRHLPSCGLIDVGNEKCFVYVPFKLFAFHFYKVVERDEFISDCFYVVNDE